MTRLLPAALLSLTALLTLGSVASAATPDAYLKAATPKMGDCCIEAAKVEKACCDKDAPAVQAAYADYLLTQKAEAAVLATTHECCAKALKAGEACCGETADGLKVAHAKKVVDTKAAMLVSSEMHACCAQSVTDGKGCCGKDAEALKADYDKQVATKAETLLMLI